MNRSIFKKLEYIESGLFKALKEMRAIKRQLRDEGHWEKDADNLVGAIREAWNDADDMCAAAELYLDEETEGKT